MFPAQTSFIPVTVALVKFIEANGFGGLYPYWYLGTTPVKYLIGPVVPLLLVGLHEVLPSFSLFDLSYLAIFTSLFLNAIGWGFLASRLAGVRKVGFVVGILVLLLPWRWFSAFGLSEVSAVLAQALTPWVLLAFVGSSTRFAFWASSVKFSRFTSQIRVLLLTIVKWLPSLLLALLFLTNSTAAIPAVVGMLILSMSGVNPPAGGQISNVKRALAVILFGWLLATLWYGLDYWLTIWGAPSVGGKSLVGAFVTLLNGLRSILPILLAIVIVYFGTKPKNIYQKFTILWLTVFLSVTLIRFMADVDFWMDWTSWMGEVEIGLVLLLASLGQSSKFKAQSSKLLEWLASRTLTILTAFLLVYFVLGWLFAWQKRDFWLPRGSIEDTVEYKIAKWLEKNVKCQMSNVKCEEVFLSGSTAFWLNSFVDVAQVRGGRDEVSKNSNWRALNWQLTQGENLNDAVASLKGLGVDFIVVHGNTSKEYYHDFKGAEKFESSSLLTKIYDQDEDVVYKINF